MCSGWHAALAAAPHLWPTTVLSAPPVDVAALSEYGCEETRTAATQKRRSAHVGELRASRPLLDTAARLSPLTQRVRLKGWMQQVHGAKRLCQLGSSRLWEQRQLAQGVPAGGRVAGGQRGACRRGQLVLAHLADNTQQPALSCVCSTL